MREMIATLRTDHVKERPELFAVDGDVCVAFCCVRGGKASCACLTSVRANTNVVRRRPGILVLINDEDWELDGRLAYALQDGDSIAFVSTLHGG